MLMHWSDELSVGNQEIDEQHKTLISLINALSDTLEHEMSEIVIGNILSALAEYTHVHFTKEEFIMKQVGYPLTQEHAAAHQVFVDQISHFIWQFDQNRTVAMADLIIFLRHWLIRHIMKEDRAIQTFIQSHNRRPAAVPSH